MAVRWLLSIGWLAITLFGASLFALVNFLVSWQAFEIIGFEDFQLAEVPLIGPIAVALGVGTAPLAAAFALGLTLIMGLLVGATVKVAWELITLAVDRRRVGAARDGELAAQYTHEILLLSLRLVVFGILAALAVRMDVALFEIRTHVLLTDAHDISDFLGLVPDSVAQLGAYLAAFADKFVWGYMACVIGTALIVEHAFGRAGVRWQGFAAALTEAIEGHPETRRPALAEATPVILPVSHAPHASNGVATPSAERVVAPSVAPEPVPAPAAASPTTPAPAPRPGAWDVEVIVGPGEVRRLALEDVERNSERFVRDSSGRQWFARQYYESVMGQLDQVQGGQR
jgi:hypothetical protein